MITLAIETATPYLALGLLTPHGNFAECRLVSRAHAEQLPAALEVLLSAAQLQAKMLERLVIGTGPGSYTGVRVGASYALGLGRACGAQVLGISTLESLINPQQDGEQAVSLNARKEHVYGAVYLVSGGVVTQTLLPAAKYPHAEFAEHAQTRLWRSDPAPDALALANAAHTRGQKTWQLQYL